MLLRIQVGEAINARAIFSATLLVLFLSLDYFATDFFSRGNVAAEGNAISALWWQLAGPLRHLDIIIEIGGAFVLAFIIRQRSEFLTLWWLNGLAFGHLMGFLSWLPYGILDLFYRITPNDQVLTIALSGTGVLLGLPLAFLQIALARRKLNLGRRAL